MGGTAGATTGEFTRGLGIYPGAAADVFSPTMRVDATTYRNLALRRAAKHSSSYDYNLTAQLVTDGIKETRMPRWVAVSTSVDGVLTKPDREIVLDHFPPVGLSGGGEGLGAGGGGRRRGAPMVDRLRVFAALPEFVAAKDLRFAVEVSDDGRAWEEVGLGEGGGGGGRGELSAGFDAGEDALLSVADADARGGVAVLSRDVRAGGTRGRGGLRGWWGRWSFIVGSRGWRSVGRMNLRARGGARGRRRSG